MNSGNITNIEMNGGAVEINDVKKYDDFSRFLSILLKLILANDNRLPLCFFQQKFFSSIPLLLAHNNLTGISSLR